MKKRSKISKEEKSQIIIEYGLKKDKFKQNCKKIVDNLFYYQDEYHHNFKKIKKTIRIVFVKQFSILFRKYMNLIVELNKEEIVISINVRNKKC